MKLVFIGSTGHYIYAFRGLPMLQDVPIRIVGVSPGSLGESMDTVMSQAKNAGFSPEYYDDYIAMLDQLSPDIAVIACHFGDHAKVAIEAMKRGVHVFIEKPLATSWDDYELLKKAHEQSQIHLAAMFGIRYTPPFLTAWQAVQDGAVGQIRLMHAQKSYRLGVRGPHYQMRSVYGGTIPWVGSHAIDWLYWYSGEQFQSVYAAHSTMDNRGHGELEMTAACHFEMTNEVMATVNIDYLRPTQAPTHGDDRIRIAGTEGVIEVRDGKVYLVNESQRERGMQELPLAESESIFADFVRQVLGHGICRVSADDSFIVTEACLRALQSADERKLVYFPM